MKFSQLEFDPAVNPGVLDTSTWNPAVAAEVFSQAADADLDRLVRAASVGDTLPQTPFLRPHGNSVARKDGICWFLASLPDQQVVLLQISEGQTMLLGTPLVIRALPSGKTLSLYPADADTLVKFARHACPNKAPQALGGVPRLGVGCRMTTALWPGAFEVSRARAVAMNPIQNSVRELNLLDDLLQARPPVINYASGFGSIETGYTGSTYEGLVAAGIVWAMQSPYDIPYGADADHVQVKRGPAGLAQAKRLLDAARYYSFYTMDMADILDYAALNATAGESPKYLAQIGDARAQQEIIRAHAMPEEATARFVGKYWSALEAMEQLTAYLQQIREGHPFDLELTIDEHPPEVGAFECLTTEDELLFLLREIRRRKLPVTHIAPNFGFEKGFDYRAPDGLTGLESRIRAQIALADEFGVLLDFHSGDDISSAPRRVVQRATGGRHHFKVSPMLQILFAEVLPRYHPELFERWWDDALGYAQREAAAGSAFAQECLREYEDSSDKSHSASHSVFQHFIFAFVGRRRPDGSFLHRSEFYTLSPEFYAAYETRVEQYLNMLVDELF